MRDFVLRDCLQVNRTSDPMVFLHNRGKIGTLVNEGTRLVGDVATAGSLRIDDYSAAGFPGYFAVEFPETDIRAEATVSETAGWFRIRYPEYVERKLLASKALNLAFSEPVVGTETVGGHVVYRFAPGWEPIVVKASENEVTDAGFDFDKAMSRVRKAWNGKLE